MTVTKTYRREDIVPRGTEIYERDIKPLVEPEHIGKYLVIDIETGEWDMDADPYAASLRAAKKNQGDSGLPCELVILPQAGFVAEGLSDRVF